MPQDYLWNLKYWNVVIAPNTGFIHSTNSDVVGYAMSRSVLNGLILLGRTAFPGVEKAQCLTRLVVHEAAHLAARRISATALFGRHGMQGLFPQDDESAGAFYDRVSVEMSNVIREADVEEEDVTVTANECIKCRF